MGRGCPEAIWKLNASGYLAIVVTNQPVIARGETTAPYPDSGFAEERPEYKLEAATASPGLGCCCRLRRSTT